jgi:hypothetical protein
MRIGFIAFRFAAVETLATGRAAVRLAVPDPAVLTALRCAALPFAAGVAGFGAFFMLTSNDRLDFV